MKHIFGPVPSRRLGRSLGIDLVPFKVCSYDCIYCQLGKTTNKTIERKEWVALDDIISELKETLLTSSSLIDYITLSGSGEPTLFSRIKELIAQIREITDIPIAVITNGSLLYRKEVREELLKADLVIPSLDAGQSNMFNAVNRPATGINFDEMLNGIISFSNEFKGEIWLEIFIMAGHTAIDSEVEKLVECVRKIKPSKVQLNTVARPTTESYAVQVEKSVLEKFSLRFEPNAEVIADYRGIHQESEFQANKESVCEMLKRRPCTVEDISLGLDIHRNETVKYIEELDALNVLCKKYSNDKLYYFIE